MNYCENCGAANGLDDESCGRCGANLPPVPAPHESLAATGAQRQASAPFRQPRGDQAALSMTADLNLPEWLKSAAADTPHDPSATFAGSGQLPPAGFFVQSPQPEAPKAADLIGETPVAPDPAIDAPKPRSSAPQPIPDWMRAGIPPQTQTPIASELADTTSFISENDLPEWIRQIADADAAKRAEEVRLATEANQATMIEATGGKRVPLPGEIQSAGHATNPWLSRRENAAAADSWAGATARDADADLAPSVERVVIPTEPVARQSTTSASDVARGTSAKRGRFALPALAQLNASMPRRSQSTTSGSNPKLRLALIAGVVILLVVLLAAMVL